MPANNTAIGPFTAILKRREVMEEAELIEEAEVMVVAFGWNDTAPQQCSGVWVAGVTVGSPGLEFIPSNSIDALLPISVEELRQQEIDEESAAAGLRGERGAARVTAGGLREERVAADSARADLIETELDIEVAEERRAESERKPTSRS